MGFQPMLETAPGRIATIPGFSQKHIASMGWKLMSLTGSTWSGAGGANRGGAIYTRLT